jgi:tripartite-type tricarboxylate transporter receptor subunit TctC
MVRAWSVVLAVMVAAFASCASAQNYPSKPVRLIVPLGAGGPTDLVGRWLAQALGEQLKQSFVVENRPGAAGLIGTVEAAKSAPDGYTLLVVASPHINLEILNPNKPYQLMRDFTAVASAFSYDAAMVVHPSVPAKNLKEFIALAKSQPGKLTYASSGPGSNKHLGGELFKLMSGTDILHVAYKGSTGARNDILGGHVNMMFDEIPSVGPNVIAGQVRALGVTGKNRSPVLPDVPTVIESGVAGYQSSGWFAFVAPAGTPADVIEKVNAITNQYIASPEGKARLAEFGMRPLGGTPQQLGAFMVSELALWRPIAEPVAALME